LVPEDRVIFADLTVEENLFFGAHPARAHALETQKSRAYARAVSQAEGAPEAAGAHDERRRAAVAIGRAMMSAPSILLLDEPSLGLAPVLCTELFRTLRRVKEAGVGIFLVEQNAQQNLAIADRGDLLDNGHIVGADTAQALAKDEKVKAAYLGE
jgi:branched-chain amino acid transport system ATP-binding protein